MKSYEPYPWTLDEVTRNNFYEVPIYQRPYTWSENEVDSLLDDLFASYHSLTSDNSKQVDGVLFTGQLFLRYKSRGVSGNTSKYEVVDGQQRLSTFSMILISVYSLALNKGCEISSKDISDLRSSL